MIIESFSEAMAIFFLSFLILQLILCFEVKKLWARLIPAALCLVAGISFIILAILNQNDLSCLSCFLAAAYVLCASIGDAIGWGVWAVPVLVKKKMIPATEKVHDADKKNRRKKAAIILLSATVIAYIISLFVPSPKMILLFSSVFILSLALVSFAGSQKKFLTALGVTVAYIILDYILSFVFARIDTFGSAGEAISFILPIGILIFTHLFIGKKTLGKPNVLIIIGIVAILAADITVSLCSNIRIVNYIYDNSNLVGHITIFDTIKLLGDIVRLFRYAGLLLTSLLLLFPRENKKTN